MLGKGLPEKARTSSYQSSSYLVLLEKQLGVTGACPRLGHREGLENIAPDDLVRIGLG